jgi:hypothetical protein
MPMDFLLNVSAAFVAGVMVVFVARWFNRQR